MLFSGVCDIELGKKHFSYNASHRPEEQRTVTSNWENHTRTHSINYLLFKGGERLGRNDVTVKIAGYVGKHAKPHKKFGLPLMQCAIVKSFSGATGKESG